MRKTQEFGLDSRGVNEEFVTQHASVTENVDIKDITNIIVAVE